MFTRLASMRQGNSWSIGYTYRADGLIASRAKTVYIYNPRTGQWTPMGLTPTRFYHDGSEPLFEESGPLNAPSIAAINVRGPDGLVARKQGATWTYYTFDQQGNVSQRLDSAGVVVSSSVYDAYGAETTTGTAPTDVCGYNAQWGYWLDHDTGLYLCQARWYDPVTGRWVTRDPIGYAGGANLYGYCGGGPVGWADPRGLYKIDPETRKRFPRAAELLERVRPGARKRKAIAAAAGSTEKAVDAILGKDSELIVSNEKQTSSYGYTPAHVKGKLILLSDSLLSRVNKLGNLDDYSDAFLLLITIEHEVTHAAELQTHGKPYDRDWNGSYDPSSEEAGDIYEREVYGRKATSAKARRDWLDAEKRGFTSSGVPSWLRGSK